MYLPYAETDKGMHCGYSIDDGHFNGTIELVANYFVKYTPNLMPQFSPSDPTDAQSLKQNWGNILEDKNTILDSVL